MKIKLFLFVFKMAAIFLNGNFVLNFELKHVSSFVGFGFRRKKSLVGWEISDNFYILSLPYPLLSSP